MSNLNGTHSSSAHHNQLFRALSQGSLAALIWMIAATLSFSLFFVIVRSMTDMVNPMQAAFLRYVFSIVLLLPVIWAIPRQTWLSLPHGWLAGRGFIHGIGTMMWFIAIASIPLAEVAALSYTTPVFIALGAAIFLRERLSFNRVTAIFFGIVGALIVVQPSYSGLAIGQIAMLVAAPLFATSDLIAKSLSSRLSSAVILVCMTVWVAITILPVAVYVWTPPTTEVLLLSCVTAVLATFGHYCFTRALTATDITALQPFRFLSLLWAALFGYIFFTEVPAVTTWIGGALIVGATAYAARMDRRARLANTPSDPV